MGLQDRKEKKRKIMNSISRSNLPFLLPGDLKSTVTCLMVGF